MHRTFNQFRRQAKLKLPIQNEFKRFLVNYAGQDGSKRTLTRNFPYVCTVCSAFCTGTNKYVTSKNIRIEMHCVLKFRKMRGVYKSNIADK